MTEPSTPPIAPPIVVPTIGNNDPMTPPTMPPNVLNIELLRLLLADCFNAYSNPCSPVFLIVSIHVPTANEIIPDVRPPLQMVFAEFQNAFFMAVFPNVIIA
jgi:hypothetical protein